jgi:hypothetical protein
MRIASLADVQDAHRLNRWIGRPAVDEVSVDLDLERPERLALLALYARHLRLRTELDRLGRRMRGRS